MSKRETWEKLRTMTAVERLRVALKADEIQVTNFGSSGDWDCQGDVEELLEENERLRAEVQASIRMNKLLVNGNERLREVCEGVLAAPELQARIDAALEVFTDAVDMGHVDLVVVEPMVKALKGEK